MGEGRRGREKIIVVVVVVVIWLLPPNFREDVVLMASFVKSIS